MNDEDIVVVTTEKEIESQVGKAGCIVLFFGFWIGILVGIIIGYYIIPSDNSFRWEKKGEVISIQDKMYKIILVEKNYLEKSE